jgi:hypothetical protein
MPKNTNRYRGASKEPRENAGRGAWRLRLRRPHPRREIVIVALFSLALILGLGGRVPRLGVTAASEP